MPSKTHEQRSSKHDVVTLFEWSAEGRPFKKRTKQYYLTALLIMLLVEVILFLFSEYLLMLVVASLVFLAFAMSSTPPKNFHYRISSEGIQIEDRFFLWQELYDFFITDSDTYNTLHVRTQAYIPGELVLTVKKEDKEKVKRAMISYLPFREYVKPTFIDRAASWLSKNFPLEPK